MAKSKSTNSAKAVTTNSAKRNSAAPTNGRSAPTASTASAQRSISAPEIGRVAGQVWGLLSRDGGQTLAVIKKNVDAPADLIVAAIGWLAREDKLEFSTTGRQVKISLR